MKILVSIKQVPVRDCQLRVAPSGRWIQESDLGFEINEPDAYALEEALQLREKHGGEVIALCALACLPTGLWAGLDALCPCRSKTPVAKTTTQ